MTDDKVVGLKGWYYYIICSCNDPFNTVRSLVDVMDTGIH